MVSAQTIWLGPGARDMVRMGVYRRRNCFHHVTVSFSAQHILRARGIELDCDFDRGTLLGRRRNLARYEAARS